MKIKQQLRKLRIALGKQILDKKTPLIEPEFPTKKILFLRHDGKIGDYVVSSFVFREIKKQAPNTHIGVVCSKKNAYLFEKNPHIDQLYFVKTKNIADYIKCGKQLAKEQYDVVIDPTVMLRNRDLLFLRTIAAKNYVGYQKERYKLFNFNVTAENAHFSEIYQKALEIIGFKNISTAYDVPTDPKATKEVDEFLATKHLKNYIAVNFFGAGSARKFSDNAMKSLMDRFTATSAKIVLLTFPEVTAKMQTLAAHYENVFVYEQTKTIFHTIELIKQASLIVSPDTSVVHIAAGFNKPMIAFYSNDEENFTHWHPNSQAETHILHFEKSVNELDFSQIQAEWLKIKAH